MNRALRFVGVGFIVATLGARVPVAAQDSATAATNAPARTLSPEEAEKVLTAAFQEEGNITNTLGMVLVWIPAGFRVAQFEVTQADFEAIAGRNPSKFQGSRRPVEKVNLADAQEFCRKLTEHERSQGKLPKSFAYQLPSEADFERYVEDTPLQTAYVSYIGDRLSTTDVGSLTPNPLGLYDVRGNVWEWCDNGVARGASYQSHEDYLNPSFRFVGKPDTALEDIGFRVTLKETGP